MRYRLMYKEQRSRQEEKSALNWGLQMFALVRSPTKNHMSEIDALKTIQMRPLSRHSAWNVYLYKALPWWKNTYLEK